MTQTVYVSQNEVAVDERPDVVLTTLLGSCVSVCLFDPLVKAGGMNHILLPNITGTDDKGSAINAMEVLLNPLYRIGCRRDRLEAKVFGGARFTGAMGDIGQQNAAFAFDFLLSERIRCIAHDVGGTRARKIRFWPSSGLVRMKMVEDRPMETVIAPTSTNDVELF